MVGSMNEAAISAAREGAKIAGQYSPLNTLLLTVAIGLLGLILNHIRLSRKITIDETVADRAGWGQLIQTLQGQVERMENQITAANKRIETLEEEKQQDHRLIIELLGQMNRSQATVILGSNNLSPTLRRAFESTLKGDEA